MAMYAAEALDSMYRTGATGGGKGDQMSRTSRWLSEWARSKSPFETKERKDLAKLGLKDSRLGTIVQAEKATSAYKVGKMMDNEAWRLFNMGEFMARGVPYVETFIESRQKGLSVAKAEELAFATVHEVQLIYNQAAKSGFFRSGMGKMLGNLSQRSAHSLSRQTAGITTLAKTDKAAAAKEIARVSGIIYGMMSLASSAGINLYDSLSSNLEDTPIIGDSMPGFLLPGVSIPYQQMGGAAKPIWEGGKALVEGSQRGETLAGMIEAGKEIIDGYNPVTGTLGKKLRRAGVLSAGVEGAMGLGLGEFTDTPRTEQLEDGSYTVFSEKGKRGSYTTDTQGWMEMLYSIFPRWREKLAFDQYMEQQGESRKTSAMTRERGDIALQRHRISPLGKPIDPNLSPAQRARLDNLDTDIRGMQEKMGVPLTRETATRLKTSVERKDRISKLSVSARAVLSRRGGNIGQLQGLRTLLAKGGESSPAMVARLLEVMKPKSRKSIPSWLMKMDHVSADLRLKVLGDLEKAYDGKLWAMMGKGRWTPALMAKVRAAIRKQK